MKQSITRDFLKYAATNMAAMVGVSVYILADTFFIAKALGAVGLTALNFAIVVYSVIQGIGLMLGTGGAIDFAVDQSRGGQRDDRAFRHTLILGAAFAMVFVAAGAWLPASISRFLGADAITLAPTRTYIATILWFSPVFLANNILLGFVRNDGEPGLAMRAMLISSLSNIVLDYVFMFPLGMGMFGAAFATGLSPLISLAILALHFRGHHSRFGWSRGPVDSLRFRQVLTLGIPALITEWAAAVTLFTFNLVILKLAGNLGVAAYGIVANVAIIATALFTGLAQGIQPLASLYFGRKDNAGLRHLRRLGAMVAFILAVLVLGSVLLWAPQISAVFNEAGDPELARMANQGMKIYFVGFLAGGINILLISYLSATLKTLPAIGISLLRSSILLIPLVLLLSRLLGLPGVWLSFPATETMVLLLSWFLAWRSQLPAVSPSRE
ncbi:MATE family efflux transporter [Clostridiaceae bacterium HFYG-1003]|nr:MATE family efflux transporter [Clostridiaceae bacterium HFYG-1003]